MTARSRMTMRGVLQVNTNTTRDAFNQLDEPAWETTGNPVPCFAWSTMKRVAIDANKTALVEDFRAMVPRGTEISDEKRFLNIEDRLGREIFAGPIYIQSIQVRQTHLELALRTVDSGADLNLRTHNS